MKKIVKFGVAVLSLAAITSGAYAAKQGTYLGAGLGASRLQTQDQFLFPSNAANNLTQSRTLGGLGGRIFGGYNFNEYVGIEAGVARYARSTYRSSIGNDIFNASRNYSMNAFNVVVKGYLPLGEGGFNLYALGGAAYVRSVTEQNVSVVGQSINRYSNTQARVRPMYGVGASYDIPETAMTTSLELSRIQGSGNVKTSLRAIPNANMLTLNLAYNFG